MWAWRQQSFINEITKHFGGRDYQELVKYKGGYQDVKEKQIIRTVDCQAMNCQIMLDVSTSKD